ncbi:C4-dicarboxylate TRAP transporter substrate-binding protein [soil metagenome]
MNKPPPISMAAYRKEARYAALIALLLLGTACGGTPDRDATSAPVNQAASTAEADTAESTDERADGEETAPPAEEETYELRFANFLGPDAAQIRANLWWAEQVEARTDGRVTVEFFHSGALLDATDTLPGIGDGRADMGYAVHFYHPGELALSSISELPFEVANPQVQTRAFNQLYRENDDFRAEWEAMGVHVLHFNPSGVIILGSGEQITSLDQLSGMQVRAVGYAAEALAERGANPIAMPAPEIYESLQRGLLNGYSSFPFEVIAAQQLQEVAPYVLDLGLGNYLITAAPINLELWNSLPSDIQDVMTEVSEELSDSAVWDIYAEVEAEVCDAIRQAGGEVSVLPEEEVQGWRDDLGDRFVEDWLDSNGGADSTAAQFLDDYRGAIEEFAAGADFESGVRTCAGV